MRAVGNHVAVIQQTADDRTPRFFIAWHTGARNDPRPASIGLFDVIANGGGVPVGPFDFPAAGRFAHDAASHAVVAPNTAIFMTPVASLTHPPRSVSAPMVAN